MLKRFLVPEADQVMVTEQAARSATQAIFEKMGLTEQDAAQATKPVRRAQHLVQLRPG